MPHCGRLDVDREINFRNIFCTHTYMCVCVRRQRGNEISGICDGLLAKFQTLAAENACGPLPLHPHVERARRN